MRKGSVIILVENQKIKVKWNNANKKWYVDKGYVFTKLHDEFFVDICDLCKSSTSDVLVQCDYCGVVFTKKYRDYVRQMSLRTSKIACKNCAGKKLKDTLSSNKPKYYKHFVNLCNQYGYTPVSKLEDYDVALGDLYIECPKHGVQKTNYIRAKNGAFCPKCGYESGAKKNSLSPEEVIKMVGNKNGNTLMNPSDYINHKTNNLMVKCGSCGRVWQTSLSSLSNGDGHCPECGIKKSSDSSRLTKDEVIKIIASRNNNIVLNPEEYVNNSVRNLKVVCQCGNVFTVSLANYIYNDVNRCPTCTKSESIGEMKIRTYLEENDISYVPQKRFEGCVDKKELPFDFYLPEYNLCVEFDGPHHFKPIYNDEEHFEKTKKHDQIKNNYCKKYNIGILRIPYWEGGNIRQILTDTLCI